MSYGEVLADLDSRAGVAIGKNDYNYATGIQQVQSQKEAAHDNTVANISGYQVPSPIGYFAGIGADAINGRLKIFDAGKKGGLWATTIPTAIRQEAPPEEHPALPQRPYGEQRCSAGTKPADRIELGGVYFDDRRAGSEACARTSRNH